MATSIASIYDGLDLGTREIRVLVLHPGQYATPITCSLERHELDATTNFEDLSYVWGDESNRRSVFVNNVTVDVTKNLEVALRHIRSTDQQRCLWVDDICINQGNDDEKAVQVSAMAQVYALASKVLIWLGPGTQISDRAMILLGRMMTAVNTTERGGWTLELPQVWSSLVNELIGEWDAASASLLSAPLPLILMPSLILTRSHQARPRECQMGDAD